jgi:hypothetical protein
MIKIFYSRSTNCGTVNETFEKICNYFESNIKIINVDINKNLLLLDKIKDSINEADFFICDLTPDGENIYSPNVMIELGYALSNIPSSEIIFILDTSKSKNNPSIINNVYYNSYEYEENSDYYMDIVKLIEDKIKNYDGNKWTIIRYSLPELILKYIKNIFDINYKSYDIKINPNKDNVIIFFNTGDKKYVGINIIKKKLYIDTKEIDLSNYKEIYDELKHLEIIANIKWFN